MNGLDKLLLKITARTNGMKINRNNLNKAIEGYDKLICFFFETFIPDGIHLVPSNKVVNEDYRYHFLESRETAVDKTFYWIFMKVVNLQLFGILKYLDYGIIYEILSENFCDSLSELNMCLNKIIEMYDKDHPDDFIFDAIKDHNVIINFVDQEIENIKSSKYMSQEYKEIMKIFRELYDMYYDDEYYKMDKDYLFEMYLNMFYYYLVINDLFISDYDNIMEFLTNIKNDIPLAIDRLYFIGKLSNKDYLTYIHNEYHNANNLEARIL